MSLFCSYVINIPTFLSSVFYALVRGIFTECPSYHFRASRSFCSRSPGRDNNRNFFHLVLLLAVQTTNKNPWQKSRRGPAAHNKSKENATEV